MSKNDPAFPHQVVNHYLGGGSDNEQVQGLTKREYAAIQFAAAIIASPQTVEFNWSFQDVAERAWNQADVLFTALKQTK